MEKDSADKLYKAILSLSNRLNSLESKNDEIQATLSAIINKTDANHGDNDSSSRIIDEEAVIADPFNFSGHKAVSLPNGGAIRLEVKPLCVNGSHILNNDSKINFCTNCSSIVCNDHLLPLNELLCIKCVKEMMPEISGLDTYVLSAVEIGLSGRKLAKLLRIPTSDVVDSIKKLTNLGCLNKDLLFRDLLTIKGRDMLTYGRAVYNIELPSNDEYAGPQS